MDEVAGAFLMGILIGFILLWYGGGALYGVKEERSKWCDKHKDRTVYEKCMDDPEYGK